MLLFLHLFFFHTTQYRTMIGSHQTILNDEAGVFEWNWWYYRITPHSCAEAGVKNGTRGQILGRNWTKVLRVFLLAINSHLY